MEKTYLSFWQVLALIIAALAIVYSIWIRQETAEVVNKTNNDIAQRELLEAKRSLENLSAEQREQLKQFPLEEQKEYISVASHNNKLKSLKESNQKEIDELMAEDPELDQMDENADRIIEKLMKMKESQDGETVNE